MKTQSSLKNISGFTFVELMIAVAIMAILTAIAVPQYQRYQAKARQAEAKIALSSIYTVESTFQTDKFSYSQCLVQLGFTPSGNTRYYAVGWNQNFTTCGPGAVANLTCLCFAWDSAGTCPNTTTYRCSTNERNFPATDYKNVLPALSTLNGTTISQNAFTVKAVGSISAAPTSSDEWTIDNNKNLTNTVIGY